MPVSKVLKENVLRFMQNNPQEPFKGEDIANVYKENFSDVVRALTELQDENYPIVFNASAKTYTFDTPVPPRLGTQLINISGLKRYAPTKEIEEEKIKEVEKVVSVQYSQIKIPAERTQPLTLLQAVEHGFENVRLNPSLDKSCVMLLTIKEFLKQKFGAFYSDKRVQDLWKIIFPEQQKKVSQ